MGSKKSDFSWKVDPLGYRLVAIIFGHSQLGELLPLGEETKVYRPLESYPVLYVLFARTSPNAPSIRKFADKFGLLGLKAGERLPLDNVPLSEESLKEGEPISVW